MLNYQVSTYTLLKTKIFSKSQKYQLIIFSEKIKIALTKALLTLPQSPDWKSRFAKFGVIKFDNNSDGMYDGPSAQVRAIPGEKLNIRYY